jgi:hypothetical protein
MAARDIQARIKSGLSKAVKKTGSANSDLVYLVSKTETGGTLTAPPSITESITELSNAIFTSYEANVSDVNILAGDRRLVCNGDVVIEQGDIVRQGSTEYIVINVDIKAPTSDVLAYIAQVRLK